MIPLSTLVKTTPDAGAEMTVRYNLLRSVDISGQAGPRLQLRSGHEGHRGSGGAGAAREMSYEFTGLSYQEKTTPNPMPTFILAVIFVFLLLAALYESWSLPWSVLLITPAVILGAMLGVYVGKFDNNVFVQIGLIMLIGLATKNAILIVEFAKMQHDQGKDLITAAIESARLRFRPILMTAFSFILGVVPLMLATGSGANSRRMMGIAVFSGMLVATIIGVFLTPAFFVIVERLAGKKKKPPNPPHPRRKEACHETAPPHRPAPAGRGRLRHRAGLSAT